MDSTRSSMKWLPLTILLLLGLTSCHGDRAKPVQPTPVVVVPGKCKEADSIPQWRVDPTTLSSSRASDWERLWQRIDDLEGHADKVQAACGTKR